jgi:hypothetical protein
MDRTPAPRDLNPYEKDVLAFLLSSPFEGSIELAAQVPKTTVKRLCNCSDHCMQLDLHVDSSGLLPAGNCNSLVSEAHGFDQDGMEIWYMLFAHRGFLGSLDISRADGYAIKQMPDIHSLKHGSLQDALNKKQNQKS